MNGKKLLTVDIEYFLKQQEEHLDSIELLVRKNASVYSINILVSNFVENLLKCVIASHVYSTTDKTTEEDVLVEIDKEIRKNSHELSELASKVNGFLDVDIKAVKEQSGFIDQYRLSIHSEQLRCDVCVKTSEASRFGAFSRSKDVFVPAIPKQTIDALKTFLESARSFIQTNLQQ